MTVLAEECQGSARTGAKTRIPVHRNRVSLGSSSACNAAKVLYYAAIGINPVNPVVGLLEKR